MPPFIPPPAQALAADTEKAIAALTAGLADPDEWLRPRLDEVGGIAAIIAAQFPDVPAATLGRVLASASMALGSVCAASADTGEPLAPWDLAVMLGFAGAKLAAAGGEMSAVQGG
jgi:peptidoglycan/LPS O-acetylase OafA/YrhL